MSGNIVAIKTKTKYEGEDAWAKPTIRAVYNEYYRHNSKDDCCYYRGDKYTKDSCPVCNRKGTIRRNGCARKIGEGM